MGLVTILAALPADGASPSGMLPNTTGLARLTISLSSLDEQGQWQLCQKNADSGQWSFVNDPRAILTVGPNNNNGALVGQIEWEDSDAGSNYHVVQVSPQIPSGGSVNGAAGYLSAATVISPPSMGASTVSTLHATGAVTLDSTLSVAGNTTLGDAATDTVTMTAVVAGDVGLLKETNHTVSVGTSTTATTAGGNLTVLAGTGATTGAGGTTVMRGGVGGNDAVGGPIQLAGGAAGGGNRAGGAASLTGGVGAGTAAGGAASVAGGVGGSTGAGGAASMVGGAAGGAAAAGGAVSITGGLGNTTGAGGALTMAGGAGGNDAVGGAASLTGGAAGGGNRAGGAGSLVGGAGAGTAAGGAIAVTGGVGGATGAGGAVAIAGGAGGATSGTGGALTIAGGAGTNGNANGGAVNIDGGNAHGSGTDGLLNLNANSGLAVNFGTKKRAAAAANTIADPGTGVAIPVTDDGVVPIVTAAAETNTLAIPSYMGQELILTMDTRVGGDRVVTASQAINQAGNTIMTFGAARDTICLRGITVGGALRWQVAWNEGVALS